jgi:hypothetical protein
MKMGTTASPWRYERPSGVANGHAKSAVACRRHYAESLNLGGPFCRTPGWRLLRRRQQQVGRDAEAGAQSLHHRHTQPFLAAKNFTDAARGAEDRHHFGSREAMLVHQVTDQIRKARWPVRLKAAFHTKAQAIRSTIGNSAPWRVQQMFFGEKLG